MLLSSAISICIPQGQSYKQKFKEFNRMLKKHSECDSFSFRETSVFWIFQKRIKSIKYYPGYSLARNVRFSVIVKKQKEAKINK